ncbi:MAG: SPASM domain-containing protein [Clostridia bacterium]|jgi:radical SAM protein with 4Fe4S-binding SPASM domain
MVVPIIYKDPKYNFIELFNPNNGTLVRFPARNKEDFSCEPLVRSYPELIDIGIMGHCTESCKRYCSSVGVDCYQRGGTVLNPHMDIEDYKSIILQSKGKTFQVALGGAGDPNKHPDFKEILEFTSNASIVPNYTTSGFMLTDEEIEYSKKHCGAVAVSLYSRLINGRESNPITFRAVERFVEAGCKVNIHYVISKRSLPEACERLLKDKFPSNIAAVVFLLYKPVGDGSSNQVLNGNENELDSFFHLAEKEHPYRIGFDTCFVPLLLKNMNNIDYNSIDSCEASRFSMYIDSRMNAYPCSFGIERGIGLSLRTATIQDVWDSLQFDSYRGVSSFGCETCKINPICHGGCLLDLPVCSESV